MFVCSTLCFHQETHLHGLNDDQGPSHAADGPVVQAWLHDVGSLLKLHLLCRLCATDTSKQPQTAQQGTFTDSTMTRGPATPPTVL